MIINFSEPIGEILIILHTSCKKKKSYEKIILGKKNM
jgi:hypothetical protein